MATNEESAMDEIYSMLHDHGIKDSNQADEVACAIFTMMGNAWKAGYQMGRDDEATARS